MVCYRNLSQPWKRWSYLNQLVLVLFYGIAVPWHMHWVFFRIIVRLKRSHAFIKADHQGLNLSFWVSSKCSVIRKSMSLIWTVLVFSFAFRCGVKEDRLLLLLPRRRASIVRHRKYQRALGRGRNVTWIRYWPQIVKMFRRRTAQCSA